MARVPDWLMNEVNSAPKLVEDSPRFRAAENEKQMQNLQSASEEAMQAVQDETNQMRANTMQTQLGMLDSITPTPTPLTGPGEQYYPTMDASVDTPMTPNIPGPADFAPASPAPEPPPAPLAGPQEAVPTAPAEEEDQVAEVYRISEATGIPPNVVASMTMLGQDIQDLEKERAAQPAAPPPAPTAPAAPMPTPLMGAAPPPTQSLLY